MVVANQTGYDFVETVDRVINFLFRRIDSGRPCLLGLANSDILYPERQDKFSMTAGSVALIVEKALALRYPDRSYRFDVLGKPNPRLFELAQTRLKDCSLVMIGDQLATDTLGANQVGIDTALIKTGLTSWPQTSFSFMRFVILSFRSINFSLLQLTMRVVRYPFYLLKIYKQAYVVQFYLSY